MRCFRIAIMALAVLGISGWYAASALAQGALPQLVGTWRGTSEVLLEKKGFTNQEVEFVILKQQGHLFTGVKNYIKEPTRVKTKETFTGVILDDGKTVYFSDADAGYNFAVLTTPDTLQIAYLHDGLGKKQPAMACYMVLTRQK
ncbi:MAG: hypothetical protein ACP59X_00435 [Solidesulfovibrio sp. DCME]|uniref:hypothetical protein n=1 Tax=Solidesulfovibrio sp. DCME TaxID=3447380 RepID=UPI003D149540